MAATRALPSGAHLLHTYVFYIGMEASVYGAIVVVVMLLEARREAAERRVAAARLERSLADARLESLQAQIRPHFLFNTLNALAVLARRGDGAAVDRAIGDLGDLLRASFASPGRHEITLGEELELVERYLGLQRIRFPDRLRVEWDVAEEARSALVPALLVQPLVENAIEHGLASTLGGRVRVRARRAGGALELEVDDDGPGFAGAVDARNGGVGLANTRERLALLHGAAATLECSNPPEGGGRVRIRLPWRDGSEGGAPVIRVALVDDEPVAREGLRMWLASEPDVEIAGEAGTPREAIALVLRERPDLLFLDVQMPDADGFSVLEAVSREHLPEVVFVTAHERHALRAFDVSALDFLLKPVREERFRAALEKARRELDRGEAREGPARLSALLDRVRGSGAPGEAGPWTGRGASSASPCARATASSSYRGRGGVDRRGRELRRAPPARRDTPGARDAGRAGGGPRSRALRARPPRHRSCASTACAR
jgi:CheY-like chemotaxis protein